MRVIRNHAFAGIAVATLLSASSVFGITLDVNSGASIRNAASQIAYDMVSYYSGNDTGTGLGLLPGPYYWWEAAAFWGSLLNYWYYTGDTTYNNITSQALLANTGPTYDFMVASQAFDEGNDDQSFWGWNAMTAAEISFPAPPSPYPSWIEMAENMWNTQVYRWNTATCGGGLKWQIYTSNAGYDYKQTISNAAFFQMAARLLRYTGNTTYLTWAEQSWDWSASIGLIDPNSYAVYDGTNDLLNCSEINHTPWTYNIAAYLLGAATMYNYTNGSSVWETRTSGLVEATALFFAPFANSTSIMYEENCETTSTCNTDEQAFKSVLSNAMHKTTQMAPYTSSAISSVLRVSAQGAAASCNGNITTPVRLTSYGCGSRWYTNEFDNIYGVGQQLSALEVIQGLLINSSSAAAHSQNVTLNTITPTYVTSTTLAAPVGTPSTSSSSTSQASISSSVALVGASSTATRVSTLSTGSQTSTSSYVAIIAESTSTAQTSTSSTSTGTSTASTATHTSGGMHSYSSFNNRISALGFVGISIGIFFCT